MGTVCPDRAALADWARELDRDDRGARTVMVGRPGVTALSLWADGLLTLPVELKLGDVIPLRVARLPTAVRAHRADDREPPLPLAADQPVGLGVAGIDEVFGRQQLALEQRLLNRLGHGDIGQGRWRGLDIGDEMRTVRVTGLGQMHFIPTPDRRPFGGKACLGVVGGFQPVSWQWQLGRGAPPYQRARGSR